jgi:hypothetical protein
MIFWMLPYNNGDGVPERNPVMVFVRSDRANVTMGLESAE